LKCLSTISVLKNKDLRGSKVSTFAQFKIHPLEGIGPIKFGMLPRQVESLVGPADQVSTNHLGQRVEFRSFMNFAFTNDTEQKLCHIGLGRQMDLTSLNDWFVFTEEPRSVIKHLISMGDVPMLYMGFLVFLELGITLTGFHDDDEPQKALTLFPKGSWDSRVPRMRAFKAM
jgi:hypothetical protein